MKPNRIALLAVVFGLAVAPFVSAQDAGLRRELERIRKKCSSAKREADNAARKAINGGARNSARAASRSLTQIQRDLTALTSRLRHQVDLPTLVERAGRGDKLARRQLEMRNTVIQAALAPNPKKAGVDQALKAYKEFHETAAELDRLERKLETLIDDSDAAKAVRKRIAELRKKLGG